MSVNEQIDKQIEVESERARERDKDARSLALILVDVARVIETLGKKEGAQVDMRAKASDARSNWYASGARRCIVGCTDIEQYNMR